MTIAGIDVGGPKKGFHLAILSVPEQKIHSIHNFTDPSQVADFLTRIPDLAVVAIDAPPRAQIQGPKTRLAERQINQAGFKIQWTRRAPMLPDSWMLNGENLWKTLENSLPQVQFIETFPTVVSRHLESCPLSLPLALLTGDSKTRATYKDFVDATLCAWAGLRHLQGNGQIFGITEDETDELGSICC